MTENRLFQLGDLVVRDWDTKKTLYRVIGIDKNDNGYWITVQRDGYQPIAHYENDGWSLYVPPSPTDAGAEEYDEIMRAQEAMK